ncbi:basic salivary proline-rich protein 2-like [Eumetopias jubatus]|uniref:basic salivary proline-rich protein 2-like n=1 Tax=Eumetopias jubatus TaxID=34886 RepID=UPI00101667F4|nr:basic salivary proline-rich protein 2-like [Eumetopias jubatus]
MPTPDTGLQQQPVLAEALSWGGSIRGGAGAGARLRHRPPGPPPPARPNSTPREGGADKGLGAARSAPDLPRHCALSPDLGTLRTVETSNWPRPAGFEVSPALVSPSGRGMGGARRKQHRPVKTSAPAPPPGHSSYPASDLEQVAVQPQFLQLCGPSLPPWRLQTPSRGSHLASGPVGLSPAPGQLLRSPPPQDFRQRSRAGPAGGAPALLTHRSPKRRARAQPGTPRHVTARAGETREAGPARGTGMGRKVVPAREGPSRHRPTSPGCRPRPQPHSSPDLTPHGSGTPAGRTS